MADGDGPGSRNFRSAYYEKLGFCGNEEKDYLDMLIASSSLDPDKLTDLWTERSLNSETDRRVVDALKVSLGVDCGRKNPFDEFANVRRVRAEHFNSLRHHLEVLIEHNVVIKDRLKKCSKSTQRPIQRIQQKRLDTNHSNDIQKGQNTSPINHENGESQQQSDTDTNRAATVNIDGDISEPENDARGQPLNGSTKVTTSSSSSSSSSSSQNNCVSSKQTIERVSPFSTNGTMINSTKLPTSNGGGSCKGKSSGLLDNIESNPASLITLMYLLEAGRLDTSDIEMQLRSEYCQKLFPMAAFFVNVSGDLQEAFFLFRNFTNNILNKTLPER